MANEPTLTLVGNLTADPELRYTPSGHPVANFNVASTPRNLNKQTNQWEDGETLFVRCAVWRDAAENAANSLTKGMRVIVTGRLRARTWQTERGEQRTSLEMDVDEFGPSLKWARAQVQKVGSHAPQTPQNMPQSAVQAPQGYNPQPQQYAPQTGVQSSVNAFGGTIQPETPPF